MTTALGNDVVVTALEQTGTGDNLLTFSDRSAAYGGVSGERAYPTGA